MKIEEALARVQRIVPGAKDPIKRALARAILGAYGDGQNDASSPPEKSDGN